MSFKGVKVTKDHTADVLQALQAIGRDRAYVGFPDAGAGRGEGPLSNAELGYLHETGAPGANIPARPFLHPAADAVKEEAAKRLKDAGQLALSGKVEAVNKTLHAIGLLGQNAARGKINEGLAPALADVTIYRRQHRKKAPRTGTKPLLDTGQLRNAITYVVRPKEGG